MKYFIKLKSTTQPSKGFYHTRYFASYGKLKNWLERCVKNKDMSNVEDFPSRKEALNASQFVGSNFTADVRVYEGCSQVLTTKKGYYTVYTETFTE